MSKRSIRSNVSKETTKLQELQENYERIQNGNAKFVFRNGDIYDGEFRIYNGQKIFKQGPWHSHPIELLIYIVESVSERFNITLLLDLLRFLFKLITINEHMLLINCIEYGDYVTDNFDIYSAQWDRDNIATDLHIQYNNGMQYKGGINVEGEMSGFGIYIFPDGSSIEGNWKKNKPHINTNFVEPSGFIWNGLHFENRKEILFEPENHFWEELYGAVNEKDEITSNGVDKLPSKLTSRNKMQLTTDKSG